MSNYLVFDIETCSLDFDSLSTSQQEYLLRGATTEEEIAKKKFEMGLSPLTAKVVCICMLKIDNYIDDNETPSIKVIARGLDENLSDEDKVKIDLENNNEMYLYNEKNLLKNFWDILNKFNNYTLISFNGRNFDAPFLMLRSAIKEVRPTKNLMNGTKYSYSGHIDLIDELTFYNPSQYGATRRFNFDYYTQAFGIKSPKSEGVDGSMVTDLFNNGKIKEIAEYCLRDVNATWELFKKLKKYMFF